MKLYTIDTGLFKLDGGAMFGVVPKSIWQKLNPPDENNMCTWAMRCLLIEEKNRLILIDTGIGNKQSEKFFSHYYLHGDDTLEKSLLKNGFTNNDITDVFLTHLHFDHVGGAVERNDNSYQLTFPHANYWSNEAHLLWATQPNAREKASFLTENIAPLKDSGRLHMIDPLHAAFAPFMNVKFVYGHTSAMMLPMIKYNGRTIVYVADLLPSVAHIPLPYIMAYDMVPLTTLAEKEAFLKEAVANDYVLFFEHDPVNECCTLQQTDKGIRVKETFPLSDITNPL